MADRPAEPNYFVKNLVAALLPYYQAFSYPSETVLYAEILQTLASYGATSRAEMLHAALSVAFGFSALEALAEAKQDTELSPAVRQRIRNGASALNRACQQNANLLVNLRICDQPSARNAPAATPKPAHSNDPAHAKDPAQANDPSDEDVDQIVRQARATIDACRNRLAQPPATHTGPNGRGTMPKNRESSLAHLFADVVAQSA